MGAHGQDDGQENGQDVPPTSADKQPAPEPKRPRKGAVGDAEKLIGAIGLVLSKWSDGPQRRPDAEGTSRLAEVLKKWSGELEELALEIPR